MNLANLFQGFATLAWLLFFGILVLVLVRASRNRPLKNAPVTVLIILAAAIVLTVVSAGLVFIEPQERGVVISALSPIGYREQALEPGLRWVIPFAERVVRYPISRQTYTMSISSQEGQIYGDDSITARTADGQEVFIDASVIFEIDPAQVVQIHIRWQDRYTNELVRAQTRGIIRDAVSQFGVEEVYSTQRDQMSRIVFQSLAEKLGENGLRMVDFVLRNITFSPEYAASIEQKQIAEQQAQQARFVVEQRRQEAEQARQVAQGRADAVVIEAKAQAESRLIQADAEAKALEVIASSIKDNPDLLTYQYITKLAPNIQALLLPSNAPFIFPLPESAQTVITPQPTPPAPTPTP
ncbi:MAG: prohibitin family protein [Chloroflexota bacterium]|jgi:regulator of protease activity HflC (stomatin/prohibitin superfamily)